MKIDASKLILMGILSALPLTSFAKSCNSWEQVDIMTESYKPYNFKEDKTIMGYSSEVLNEVFSRLGVDKTLKLYPWARGYADVQDSSKCNMLYSMTRNAVRENLFQWAGPVADTVINVYVRNDYNGTVNSVDDLKKMKVSAVKGGVVSTEFDAAGVKYAEQSLIDHVIKSVRDKKADVFAYESISAGNEMDALGIPRDTFKVSFVLKRSQLYFAFNKSVDSALVVQFRNMLEEVKNDKAFIKSIHDKYPAVNKSY